MQPCHSHHEHHPLKEGRAFLGALVLNAVFVFVEATYAYLAHSSSLLADAGHNAGDVLGLAFAALANRLLRSAPSAQYSYGLKRTTVLASLCNAVVLLMTTALIFREAIPKFFSDSSVDTQTMWVVSLLGIVINGGSALLFRGSSKDDLNIRSALRHMLYDMLMSAGVVLGAICIALTGWNWIDPVLAIVIAGIIFVGSFDLLKQSYRLMVDGVPSQIDLLAVKSYLESIEGVSEVHDLHIWGISTRETALTAHLRMPKAVLSDEQRHTIEQHLGTAFNIQHSTLQIEKNTGPLSSCLSCE